MPWGKSACFGCFPGSSLSFGRYSAPPIHQFPCCLALSLLRAFGLSPNVGWLLKAVPVLSHPPIPSSKSKLQATLKTKKEKKRNFLSLRIPYGYIPYWVHFTVCTQLLLLQYAPVNPEGHLQRNPLSVYPA